MPEIAAGPDVVAGVIARAKAVLGAGWVVTDEFPVDGAFGVDRLCSVVTTYDTDIDSRFTSLASVTVDIWALTRVESFRASDNLRRGFCVLGGFRLDEHGVVTRGIATLRPVREPSGDPSSVYVRHTATYDLNVRAAPAA